MLKRVVRLMQKKRGVGRPPIVFIEEKKSKRLALYFSEEELNEIIKIIGGDKKLFRYWVRQQLKKAGAKINIY